MVVNYNDLKYVKSRNTSCNRGILALNKEDSHICCDSITSNDSFICSSSFDDINKILSSLWAFGIPLLPFCVNVVLNNCSRWQSNAKRLIVYISIFAFRTVL